MTADNKSSCLWPGIIIFKEITNDAYNKAHSRERCERVIIAGLPFRFHPENPRARARDTFLSFSICLSTFPFFLFLQCRVLTVSYTIVHFVARASLSLSCTLANALYLVSTTCARDFAPLSRAFRRKNATARAVAAARQEGNLCAAFIMRAAIL